MYDGRTRLASQVADEVRSHFGERGAADEHPALGAYLRGAELRADGADLRPGIERCAVLPRGGARDRAARASACSYDAARTPMSARQNRPAEHGGGDPVSERRRGLGRGLGALIPAAPTGEDSGAAGGGRPTLHLAGRGPGADRGARGGGGEGGHAASGAFHVKPSEPLHAERSRGRCAAPPRRPVRTSPSCRSTPSRRTRASRVRSSTRTPWPSWSPPSRRSAFSSRSSCGRSAPERYELIMGERRWRACREAGLERDPGDRPGHRRREASPGRAAGEPAPGAAEPAGRGCRLRPVAEGLQLHARPAGGPDRALASAGLQHAAAAEALPAGPAPGRGRGALGRACAGAALRGRLGGAGPAGPPDRGRGAVGAGGRGDRHPDGLAAAERSASRRARGPAPGCRRR